MSTKIESTPDNSGLKKVSMLFGVLLLISASVYLVFLIRSEYKKYDYIGRTAEMQNEISISGEAKIVAVPDVAKVDLSVISENFNVTTAQSKNTEKMNAIIAELTKIGIEQKDLKTTSYNIYPQYDWTETGRVFKGYQVTQSLEVKIRDTQKVSEVLASAGNLKVDSIGNLRFEIDDPEVVKQEARIQAIENAKLKAEELADSLGVKLGRVVNFNESSYAPQPYYLDYAKTESLGVSDEVATPQIQTGESEITANVIITYEIL